MDRPDFYDLTRLVVEWGHVKGIFLHSDPKTQALKFFSEAGELADAVAVDDEHDTVDALGDVLVTLILLAEMKGLNLEECLSVAYDVISKRNGSMINGIFVKDNVN